MDPGSVEWDIAFVLRRKVPWPRRKADMPELVTEEMARIIAAHLELCGWEFHHKGLRPRHSTGPMMSIKEIEPQ